MPRVSDLEQGDWLKLGRYGQGERADPIMWRVVQHVAGATSLISAHVLTDQPFDDERRGYQFGDNRWSQCTLRSRLACVTEGFLRRFLPEELELLVPVVLETEVRASYSVPRPAAVDTTEDRVWVATWEEYQALPETLRGATPSRGYLRDHPEFARPTQSHWSRSALERMGCAVLDLWFDTKAESNSGAAQPWGLRPWIALENDAPLTGRGTESEPFRIAQ